MHYLDRSSVSAPACLSQYRHGSHNWEDVTITDKQTIRNCLEVLQCKRCAYCECSLSDDNQHIEHFVQKGRVPRVTFAWDNLFWSCCSKDSCGIHKDKSTYNPADLIKPDVDDPEHFFRFNFDGTITVRSEITDTEKKRASETLRVFNLDPHHGRLRAMRRSAVAGYVRTAEDIAEIIESDPEFGRVYLEDEIEQTKLLPFATTIKHVLSIGAIA